MSPNTITGGNLHSSLGQACVDHVENGSRVPLCLSVLQTCAASAQPPSQATSGANWENGQLPSLSEPGRNMHRFWRRQSPRSFAVTSFSDSESLSSTSPRSANDSPTRWGSPSTGEEYHQAVVDRSASSISSAPGLSSDAAAQPGTSADHHRAQFGQLARSVLAIKQKELQMQAPSSSER